MPRNGEEEGWPGKGAKRKKGRAKTMLQHESCYPAGLAQSTKLVTFLAGASYWEFREFMRILTTFLGKTTEIHHN